MDAIAHRASGRSRAGPAWRRRRRGGHETARRARRRTGAGRRQPSRRRHRVEFSLTDEEFAALCETAGQAGLARGAVLGRGDGGQQQLLQDALAELSRCAIQVRKIGVNLNQAVAKLNATGQADGNLVVYAAASIRMAERLGEAAAQVRRAALR